MIDERPRGVAAARGSARSWRFAAALALAVVLARPAAAETVRRGPGSITSAGFSMPRAGADQYGASSLTCPPGGLLSILEGELSDRARKANRPVPQADGALCAAAEALMGWTDTQLPPETVRRFIAWHLGLPVPLSRVYIDTVDTEDFRTIGERLVQLAATFTKDAVAPRFGVATNRVRRETTRLVLVLVDGPIELKPVPRRLPVNGEFVVEGRLLGDYRDAKVFASNPIGTLETVAGQGNAFHAKLACGQRTGRMQVEIRGDRGEGPATVANFPVACGTDLPTVAAIPPAPTRASPADADRDARKMLDLMNGDRSAAGLGPLAWDDAVAGVAREAAEYLRGAMTGRPTGGAFDLRAKLKAKDVASALILQNPVAAPSLQEAHELIVNNPVDRANVLTPEATHAGIGAVPNVGDPPILFFSALMVKQLPPIDPAEVATRLRAAIAKRRADARAAPLTEDPVLDGVAAKYAAALAASRGELAPDAEKEIVAPLYKGFRTVNVMSGVKADPLEFAEESAIVGDVELMGLGVATGTSPSLGKNSAFVVVLTGTHHKPADAHPKGSGAPPAKAKRR